MAYLTFNDLNSSGFTGAKSLNESIQYRNYRDVQVFLSYRRKDREWVNGVVRFLKRIGVSVYIDYLDETLDDRENSTVASQLRERINGCKKFISLATPNSGQSKWMPWELGLGDRIVNYHNVAMLPLTNNRDQWSDQEYSKIYARIENQSAYSFSDDWQVIYPDGSRRSLSHWLLS